MKIIDKYERLNVSDLSSKRYKQLNKISWNGQTIRLARTPQKLGGFRLWLICPLCNAKRMHLYNDHSGTGCRECLNLYYKEQDNKDNRYLLGKGLALLTKFTKMLADLNPEEAYIVYAMDFVLDNSIISYYPNKPKGMHWKTFSKELDKIDQVRDKLINLTALCSAEREEHHKRILEQYNLINQQQAQK